MRLSIFSQTHHTFEGKRDDETVEIFLYSHWIIMALKIIFYFFLAFLPLLPMIFFAREIVEYESVSVTLFALLAYYLLLWSTLFYEAMIYLLDTWIVTNDRILDIVQRGFFYRTVSELNLAKIQDISVRMKGIMQTVFDYGDIEIQSAGTVNKFLFRQVSHPHMIKDEIMKLVLEAKKRESGL